MSEPSIADLNDFSPMVPKGKEKEPVALIDTTGSMSWPVAEGSELQRRTVLEEAMSVIVNVLAKEDSQATREAEEGEGKGGLLAVTFAGGQAKELGDLTPENWHEAWSSIKWGGGTQIMPGWNKVTQLFEEEFGKKSDRPDLLCVVFTDGEATDTAEFATEMESAPTGTHVCIALQGFGAEHDQAVASYQEVAKKNSRIRVISFASETDPHIIAQAVLSIVD